MKLDFAETQTAVSFFVAGRPAPGGSKRYVGQSKKGRAILVDMGGSHTKQWRAAVSLAGRALKMPPLTGPLYLECLFVIARPKKHFYTNKRRAGQLREDAPHWHTIAPDTTKLLRSTEDALKGITWADDAQVAKQTAEKIYGEETGCHITITQL